MIEFINPLTLVCLFGRVSCTALIPASQASSMYGPISSHCMGGLHRDGIIMVSCSAYYGVYVTTVVSVISLYPSENDGGPHRNCSLTRVVHVPSTFLRKLSEINTKFRT